MNTVRNLIPFEYFTFKSTGESKYTFHAGSYHLALYLADIHECNIMTYSSIIPPQAKEIDKPELYPGQELKCIMSRMDGRYGEKISAGIAFAPILNEKGDKRLSLVVERSGNFDEDSLKEILNDSLYELYNKTFSEYKMDEQHIQYITKSFVPEDAYGTVLVGLCFTSFIQQ
jgi:arginine decarboxylase